MINWTTWQIDIKATVGGHIPLHLTITIFPSLISLTNLDSLPSHFCTCISLSPSTVKVDCKHKHSIVGTASGQTPVRANVTVKIRLGLTLTCLSSGVVSSNSSPSLAEISVFLKVLRVFTTTLSPSRLMVTVGLVTLPTCLVAKPTPVQEKK